jgi:4-hydroxy-tetrahydrodipicolinate reductase
MNIALIGYGKMGKAIEAIIRKHNAMHSNHMHVVAQFSKSNHPLISAAQLNGVDVAIEFTTPLTAVEHMKLCFDAGVPVVVGSTGWYHQLDEVTAYCKEKNGALLYAANFSIGVNLFFKINAMMASLMQSQPQYQLSISETHHTQKLDAPSGTAIKTAQVILENWSHKNTWKLAPTTDENAIPITAHRVEHVPGTHEVIYRSTVDEIQLMHTAFSRDGFAEGAVTAAQWLLNKNGVFTMQDVLAI